MSSTIFEKMKQNVFVYLLAALMLTIGLYIVIPVLVEKVDLFSRKQVHNGVQNNIIELENQEVKQTFVPYFEKLNGIEVRFCTYGKLNHGDIVLELWDDSLNQKTAEITKRMELLKDNQNEMFYFDKTVSLDKTHTYSIRIRAYGVEKDDVVALYIVEEDTYGEGTLTVSGITEGDLLFSTYGINDGCANKPLFFICMFILLILICLMVFYIVNENKCFDHIGKMDMVFVISAMFFCCTLFNQGGDMSITIKHSRDLISLIKSGDFLEFYTIVLDKALSGGYGIESIQVSANYNIVLYLLLAIGILPFVMIYKLLGVQYTETGILLWVNLLLTIAVVYSGFLLYKIALDMKMKENRAKMTGYLYLSSILLIFSTVGFSQLDIFYILIMLWALRKYLNYEYVKFSLFMSVAIMLKSFPIIIFVPLILVVEKRLLHIIKYLLLGVSSTLVYGLIFGNNYGYAVTKEELGELYNFAGRLFASGTPVGIGNCAFYIVIVVCLCVWIFGKECKKEDVWKYVIIIPTVLFGTFMIFVGWHPQWLAVLAPFLALALGTITKNRELLYCEWGIGVMYCIVSMWTYQKNVDVYMVNHGVLPMFTNYYYQGITFREMVEHIDYFLMISSSVLVALLGYFCYNTTMEILHMKDINDFQNIYLERGSVWIRIAFIYGLCMMFLICYFYIG